MESNGYWIEHRDENGEFWTIGDEPFPGDTADEAWAEYVSQMEIAACDAPNRDEYRITRAI